MGAVREGGGGGGLRTWLSEGARFDKLYVAVRSVQSASKVIQGI